MLILIVSSFDIVTISETNFCLLIRKLRPDDVT